MHALGSAEPSVGSDQAAAGGLGERVVGRECISERPDSSEDTGDWVAGDAEALPGAERALGVLSGNHVRCDQAAQRARHLGVDKVRGMDLLGGEGHAGRASVE